VALFTVPAHALYFGGYEASKRALLPLLGDDAPPAVAHFASGVVADVFGALLWCPQDVVKQKLQVQEHRRGQGARYLSALHALRLVAREEGVVGGLYRGFAAAVVVYAPMVALHFTLYEELKRRAAAALRTEQRELPRAVYLSAALVSASLSALVTTPLDVVKTRLQVRGKSDGGYSGMREAIVSTWTREGPRAFFRGATARTLWLGPNAALAMLFCALPPLSPSP
jgi:solute carrier family 25 iron transporter 28/37